MSGDELIIDLSNYKDRVGSRVAPGTYRVQVEDAEPAESNAKNPMINLWFRIIGTEFDGQTITDRLVLTDKSLFRVVGFMQAIGLPTPKKRLKVNVRQFVGKVLEISVDDGEPYNGRVKSEVRSYQRVAGSGSGADIPDDLEGLGEFMPESDGTDDRAVDLPEDSTPTAPEVPAEDATAAAAPADEDADDSVNLDEVQL